MTVVITHRLKLGISGFVLCAAALCGTLYAKSTEKHSKPSTIMYYHASWVGGGSTLSQLLFHNAVTVDLVVEGTFTSQKPGVDSNTLPTTGVPTLPFTDSTLHIKAVVFGTTDSTDVVVHQTGGIVNGTMWEFMGDPLFAVGDSYILFLHRYAPNSYFVSGGPSGRFQIDSTGKIKSFNPAGIGQNESLDNFLSDIKNTHQ